jgi:hypothetical protein
MTTAPRARKPLSAPTPSDLAERDRYAQLTASSLQAVRASAQTWRNGLAAFITLVTTGVIIKGRDTTAGIATGWRAAVSILVAAGLAMAVAGLWQTLCAEAGTDPKKQTLEEIRATHGTLTTYEVALAGQAAQRLQRGRYAVLAALVLLLAGVATTWWAPGPPSSSSYILITHGNTISCGVLQPGDGNQLQVLEAGNKEIDIPLSSVAEITATSSCP